MASGMKLNAKSPTVRRIMREAAELENSPSADYTATPLESDLFEWHFTLRGPPNSSYGEGIYHGRIVLPPTYPLRPPSFRFLTPSGRFEVNREICLSISGHHEETWQPAWGVRTALVALRSFMETDPKGQVGGLDTSDAVRKQLAAESHAFRCPACAKANSAIIEECEQRAKESGGESSAKEPEIPVDLKLGFRDEMEKAAKEVLQAESSGSRVDPAGAAEDSESAELAEGFVQTVPPQERRPVRDPASLPARPAQGVPQPTRTVPIAAPGPQRAQAVPIARAYPDANPTTTPQWIDTAIIVLAVALTAMILKVLLGL